jgi:hypothetical protein
MNTNDVEYYPSNLGYVVDRTQQVMIPEMTYTHMFPEETEE